MPQFVYLLVVLFGVACLALIVEAVVELKRKEAPLPAAPQDDAALARAVATALRLGIEVNSGWKDYGGHGLVFRDGKYIFGPSYDGVIENPEDSAADENSDGEDRAFESEDEFASWLALKMSEQGPCLLFHQCISRQRLESAASHGLLAQERGERVSVRV